MQNEANFKKMLIDAKTYSQRTYENIPPLRTPKNKTKANVNMGKIDVSCLLKRDYEKNPQWRPKKTNPKQTQLSKNQKINANSMLTKTYKENPQFPQNQNLSTKDEPKSPISTNHKLYFSPQNNQKQSKSQTIFFLPISLKICANQCLMNHLFASFINSCAVFNAIVDEGKSLWRKLAFKVELAKYTKLSKI